MHLRKETQTRMKTLLVEQGVGKRHLKRFCRSGTDIESQNSGGWKGPLWVIQSNPLPKQGHPEPAAQDIVQAGLEYPTRPSNDSTFMLIL